MAQHVELSLPKVYMPQARHGQDPDGAGESTLRRWSTVVDGATEPSLVIDARDCIIAVSAPGCEMLGLGDPALAVGRSLLTGVQLIDFTATPAELTEPEITNIPPLLAVSSGRLARGLLRVRRAAQPPSTVDAISTPLRDNGTVVGSLTFFMTV